MIPSPCIPVPAVHRQVWVGPLPTTVVPPSERSAAQLDVSPGRKPRPENAWPKQAELNASATSATHFIGHLKESIQQPARYSSQFSPSVGSIKNVRWNTSES